MARLIRRRPRYADIVGTLALLVAVSGTAYAAHALPRHSVGPAQLRSNAVSSAKIKNGKVKGKDLALSTLTGAQVADRSLSLVDLVGVDTTVTISATVNADACQTFALNVPGAAPGQVAVLVPTTNTTGLVFSPPRVSAPGVVTTRGCAVGIGALLLDAPFRVLTLN